MRRLRSIEDEIEAWDHAGCPIDERGYPVIPPYALPKWRGRQWDQAAWDAVKDKLHILEHDEELPLPDLGASAAGTAEIAYSWLWAGWLCRGNWPASAASARAPYGLPGPLR